MKNNLTSLAAGVLLAVMFNSQAWAAKADDTAAALNAACADLASEPGIRACLHQSAIEVQDYSKDFVKKIADDTSLGARLADFRLRSECSLNADNRRDKLNLRQVYSGTVSDMLACTTAIIRMENLIGDTDPQRFSTMRRSIRELLKAGDRYNLYMG